MKVLYSNLFPLPTEKDQKTISECFYEQVKKADEIDIAVGYISKASLEALDSIIEEYHIKILLIIGMYMNEGMPESSYHVAMSLNDKWRKNGYGEIKLVKPFSYHGKVYCFVKDGTPFSVIMGSANLSVIKPDAMTLRQYEIASLITEQEKCLAFLSHVQKLSGEICSEDISKIKNVKLIREKNTSLAGVEKVVEISSEETSIYFGRTTNISFLLPMKVPSKDNPKYMKSNINVCYAAPRSKNKSRDWYELQMTVSKDITTQPGYPEKDKEFIVVTDDGYKFKAHTTSDHNKQFSAVGDELLMGRWLKGRLVAAGLVEPINNTGADTAHKGMITQEMLDAYGCHYLKLSKTSQKELDDSGKELDVWTLAME